MSLLSFVQSVSSPLRSRKVRVALATVLAAYAAHAGLDVGEEIIHTVLGVGMALILGIAHEDAGSRSTPPGEERT